MKLLEFNLLLLLILVGSCKEKTSEVIIKGKVKGDIPYAIAHTAPINQAAYTPFKEVIIPDSLGNFKIKIPIEKAAFVKIMIHKEDGFQQIINATLVVEPGKHYVVNFDLNKKDKTVDILGFNKVAQKQLNALENPDHIQIGASPFLKDSIAKNIASKIDSLKNIDISKFEEFYKNNSISKEFFDLVKLDRDYYYTALKGTVGFVKFLMNERTEGLFNDEIKTMWESCFKNNLLTRPDFQNTAWGYAFAENYLYYKGYEEVGFDAEKFRATLDNLPRITNRINQVNSLLPKGRHEFYKASFLFGNLIQKDYEEELITVFNEFNKEFPNSNYKKHLLPLIDEVRVFHETVKRPFNEDISFMENYKEMDHFDEVVKSLKGKKAYVDFWATWCGPCKTEFKYNKELKVLLNKYDYKTIYVSIDREEKHQQWLDMIKFYDLKGIHLRVNKALAQEITEMGVNYIPRYFLVDENGNILENKAKKPSELRALEEQLIKLEH